MRRTVKWGFLAGLVLVCVAGLGCPKKATFPFYVSNFTPAQMTELKMADGDTGEFVNILEAPISKNTLRVVYLDKARFESSLGDISFKLDSGFANSVIGRIDEPAGRVGFGVKEANAQTVYHYFIADDTAVDSGGG